MHSAGTTNTTGVRSPATSTMELSTISVSPHNMICTLR